MKRNTQLIRVLNVIFEMLTQSKRFTARELSKIFLVHPKTIRRDMIAIKASKFDLKISIQDDEKAYYLEQQLKQ